MGKGVGRMDDGGTRWMWSCDVVVVVVVVVVGCARVSSYVYDL